MPHHAKAWKFKCPLSQNEEPFRNLKFVYITLGVLGTVMPHEIRNSEGSIDSFLSFEFW